MRFVSPRDYATILKINQELINKIIDTPVVMFKIHQELTEINSYGESTKKTWYNGVEVPSRIKREPRSVDEDVQNINISQDCTFSFLREELIEREIYPELGDIVYFDSQYYEIHNVNEIQMWGGQVTYKHSIVCDAHLTRKSALQLEGPQK